VFAVIDTASFSRISCDPAAGTTAPLINVTNGLALIFSLEFSPAVVTARAFIGVAVGVSVITIMSEATPAEIVIKRVKPCFAMYPPLPCWDKE
jgi:hypothetical protein